MIWKILEPYFSKNENWGNPEKLNGFLLLLLYQIRLEVSNKIIIHNAYAENGHTKNSQHYIGNAVDFHVQGIQFGEAIRLVHKTLKGLQIENKVGLGIYPQWVNPGFHLDVRGYKARWSKIDGNYVSFDAGLLKIVEKNLSL